MTQTDELSAALAAVTATPEKAVVDALGRGLLAATARTATQGSAAGETSHISATEAIGRLRAALGDDVWTHHEFFRLGGKVVSIDIPIIWFSGAERLAKINETYEAHGFPVYDAHINQVEGGGLHNADYSHLAWKKRLDPKGLLNSAKSAAWQQVKHLSPEEIEAKAVS